MEKNFKPYNIYIKNIKQITEFNQLSELSLGLAQQLLFKYPKKELSPLVLNKERVKTASYSMADMEIDEVKEVCTWISFKEYAKKTGKSLQMIEELAMDGQLGRIKSHPEDGKGVLIWPQEFKDKELDKLPEPGKNQYSVSCKVTVSADIDLDIEDVDNFEDIQKQFLYMAHSMGKPDEVTERASEMFYRSSLIHHWTAFEVYLRSAIHELFRLNPKVLIDDKQVGKTTITYKEIFSLSDSFSNIEELRKSMIELEIQRQESNSKSVHGLINFLKDKFKFKKDPYEGWYVFNGVRYNTHYNDLMEIKEVRNALIHDAGFPNKSFFSDYPNVPNREGYIVIDQEYYLKCKLILNTIAFNITKSIPTCVYTG